MTPVQHPYEIPSQKLLNGLLDEQTLENLSNYGIDSQKKFMESPLRMLMGLGLSPQLIRNIKSQISEHLYTPEYDLSEIPFIGENMLTQLRAKGLSVEVIELSSIDEISSSYDIPPDLVRRIQEYIRTDMRAEGFLSALDILHERQNRGTITTGCEAIDGITFVSELGSGGIRTGETTEFFGPPRTGKTQFCLQLCITTQLPEELGGLGKKSLFIDTEGTFAPSRIIQIAKDIKERYNWNKDVREILQDIQYAKVSNSDQQKTIVKHLITHMDSNVGLLVVDSISALFRSEYSSSDIVKRQQSLNEHLNTLFRLATGKQIAVVVTNQVSSSPQVLGDSVRAVGGNIIGHWANTRLELSSIGQSRSLKIFDSSALPELHANYQIVSGGIH